MVTGMDAYWNICGGVLKFVALSGKLNSFDALYKMYNDEELLEQPE